MRQINIIGSIGKDGAQWNPGRSGEFLSFSVATSNGKNKDGSYKPNTYINCTMFDSKYAQNLEPYLTAGTRVFIQGEVNARGWTDKQGKPQGGMSCTVSKLEFIGGGKKDESSSNVMV